MMLSSKFTFSLIVIVAVVMIGVMVPSVFAEEVPDWMKSLAGWWAEDTISEMEFVNAVGFLINEDIIQIQDLYLMLLTEDIISETEYVNAVGFLINKDIIQINNECKFETDTYTLLNMEETKKNKWYLCNLNHEYLSDWAEPKTSTSKIELNSKGFRGVEFSEIKEDNTIRIFTVGGSTTYGNGVTDEYTYPAILQKKINELKLEKNIEIINAGYGGAWSKTETDLIKNKLLQYEPDIFIIYDGWNEIQNEVFNKNNNEQQWKDRWIDICKLGNEKKFETIILLQPTVGTISTDKRIPVDQELIIQKTRPEYQQFTQAYLKYPNVISELNQNCTVAKNFQNIFDEVYSAIFYDYGHTNALGNEILATNVLEEIKPILNDKFKINVKAQESEINVMPALKLIPEKLDYRAEIIRDTSFANEDLKNFNFQYALLYNVDFSNANLEGADFRSATIVNSKFIDADLEKSIFAQSTIEFTDFSGANLENSYITLSNFEKTNFSNSNLMNSKIMGAKFFESNFLNSKLNHSQLTHSELYDSNIFDANFSNITLAHIYLVNCDASGKDLSGINIQYKTHFVDCNMNKTTLPLELEDTDFTAKLMYEYGPAKGTSLSEVNFSNVDISKVLFSASHDIIYDNYLDNKKWAVYGVDLSFANLSNKNLSNKMMTYTNLSYADLSNTDLSFASLQFANLEGANLEGANLEGANLESANLQFANLEGANLKCTNHEECIG
jgi:uncharacterized protein YjbI with pentapeptide repeats/lysophospholipase L1-like esterase